MQILDKIRRDVNISARKNTQGYFCTRKFCFEAIYCSADISAGVVVDGRQNVGGAHDCRNALRNRYSRHFQRNGEIAGAIIEPRQHMAVQINHPCIPSF